MRVRLTVNGVEREADAEPRLLLSDFVRHRLGLTGTHVGCEHGVCGACTVLLDDEPVRACLLFAVQVDGRHVMTVEGLAEMADPRETFSKLGASTDVALHPLQQAFQDKHALQCGFCTPGILLAARAFLRENPAPTPEQIREMLAGHLCRCTGYHFIVEAIDQAARLMRGQPGSAVAGQPAR